MTLFRSWRERLGLTQAGAAARLDYGKRTIEAWDRGEEEPPLVVRYAMTAIVRRLKPYTASACATNKE